MTVRPTHRRTPRTPLVAGPAASGVGWSGVLDGRLEVGGFSLPMRILLPAPSGSAVRAEVNTEVSPTISTADILAWLRSLRVLPSGGFADTLPDLDLSLLELFVEAGAGAHFGVHCYAVESNPDHWAPYPGFQVDSVEFEARRTPQQRAALPASTEDASAVFVGQIRCNLNVRPNVKVHLAVRWTETDPGGLLKGDVTGLEPAKMTTAQAATWALGPTTPPGMPDVLAKIELRSFHVEIRHTPPKLEAGALLNDFKLPFFKGASLSEPFFFVRLRPGVAPEICIRFTVLGLAWEICFPKWCLRRLNDHVGPCVDPTQPPTDPFDWLKLLMGLGVTVVALGTLVAILLASGFGLSAIVTAALAVIPGATVPGVAAALAAALSVTGTPASEIAKLLEKAFRDAGKQLSKKELAAALKFAGFTSKEVAEALVKLGVLLFTVVAAILEEVYPNESRRQLAPSLRAARLVHPVVGRSMAIQDVSTREPQNAWILSCDLPDAPHDELGAVGRWVIDPAFTTPPGSTALALLAPRFTVLPETGVVAIDSSTNGTWRVMFAGQAVAVGNIRIVLGATDARPGGTCVVTGSFVHAKRTFLANATWQHGAWEMRIVPQSGLPTDLEVLGRLFLHAAFARPPDAPPIVTMDPTADIDHATGRVQIRAGCDARFTLALVGEPRQLHISAVEIDVLPPISPDAPWIRTCTLRGALTMPSDRWTVHLRWREESWRLDAAAPVDRRTDLLPLAHAAIGRQFTLPSGCDALTLGAARLDASLVADGAWRLAGSGQGTWVFRHGAVAHDLLLTIASIHRADGPTAAPSCSIQARLASVSGALDVDALVGRDGKWQIVLAIPASASLDLSALVTRIGGAGGPTVKLEQARADLDIQTGELALVGSGRVEWVLAAAASVPRKVAADVRFELRIDPPARSLAVGLETAVRFDDESVATRRERIEGHSGAPPEILTGIVSASRETWRARVNLDLTGRRTLTFEVDDDQRRDLTSWGQAFFGTFALPTGAPRLRVRAFTWTRDAVSVSIGLRDFDAAAWRIPLGDRLQAAELREVMFAAFPATSGPTWFMSCRINAHLELARVTFLVRATRQASGAWQTILSRGEGPDVDLAMLGRSIVANEFAVPLGCPPIPVAIAPTPLALETGTLRLLGTCAVIWSYEEGSEQRTIRLLAVRVEIVPTGDGQHGWTRSVTLDGFMNEGGRDRPVLVRWQADQTWVVVPQP